MFNDPTYPKLVHSNYIISALLFISKFDILQTYKHQWIVPLAKPLRSNEKF